MRILKRFKQDETGLSAVEFALILPVMIPLLVGGAELSNALQVDRKTSSVASSIADLAAQATTISNSDRDNMFSAADSLMVPWDPSGLTIVISSITYINNQATVAWSEGHRKAAHNPGDVVTLPPGIIGAGTSVIMAEVTYAYHDPLGGIVPALTGSYNFTSTFYDRPRLSVAVARTP